MTDAEAIAAAREIYAAGSDDNIEIDDNPNLSHAESGVWVAAWVWVAYPQGEEE